MILGICISMIYISIVALAFIFFATEVFINLDRNGKILKFIGDLSLLFLFWIMLIIALGEIGTNNEIPLIYYCPIFLTIILLIIVRNNFRENLKIIKEI